MTRPVIVFFALWCCASSRAQTVPFQKQQQLCILQDTRLKETSGIAASALKSNYFWLHNDSGDSARMFFVNSSGTTKGVVYFNQFVLDCEDIASAAGIDKTNYIYLGDIGDNYAFRPSIQIYIFKETDLLDAVTNQKKSITNYRKVLLHYEDGSRDAEALMIDPVDSTLCIVSKKEAKVHLYQVPLKDVFSKTSLTLKKTAELSVTDITAGDISRKGDEILLRNYDHIYYWKRDAGEPLAKALLRKPLEIPYQKETQGEAIGFASDGSAFYTASEGVKKPVYIFKRSP